MDTVRRRRASYEMDLDVEVGPSLSEGSVRGFGKNPDKSEFKF